MSEDQSFIVSKTKNLFQELRDRHIFITGATGFFGQCLIESFNALNAQAQLNIHLHLLSRDWQAFKNKHPSLIKKSFTSLYTGDLSQFQFPDISCDFIIHAAKTVSHTHPSEGNNRSSLPRLLEWAESKKAKRILFTSSGAVYKNQQTPFTEDSPLLDSATDPRTAYGYDKVTEEQKGMNFAKKSSCDFLAARCFTFVGPRLPADGPYAIRHFIDQLNRGETLEIHSPQTTRSYLHTRDLMIWLLHILIKGENASAYNVGSDQPVTMEKLALTLKNLIGSDSQILLQNLQPSSYFPSIEKSKTELQLSVFTPLEEALRRSLPLL